MNYLHFVVIFAVLIVETIFCDEGFYINSDAAFSAGVEVNLLHPPNVKNEIITSNVNDAGTTDNIKVTYIGSFANSGPHSLGSFIRGTTSTVDIQLTRKIGDLRKIVLENNGVDNWLLSAVYCTIGNVRYELYGTKVWLESMDPTSEALYEDAFSPNAQVTLPSASRIEIEVSNQMHVYSVTGLV